MKRLQINKHVIFFMMMVHIQVVAVCLNYNRCRKPKLSDVTVITSLHYHHQQQQLYIYFNKCIGDDTKAAARQSTDCITNQK